MNCEANGIEHRLTKPNHPWTNGPPLGVCRQTPAGQRVERMNRTIKDATVKRYHYDSHDQLRTHLADFHAAYNFARRLKMLNGLTPYEYICKIWTSEPERFIPNPIHQMPGLNIKVDGQTPAPADQPMAIRRPQIDLPRSGPWGRAAGPAVPAPSGGIHRPDCGQVRGRSATVLRQSTLMKISPGNRNRVKLSPYFSH